MLKMINRLFNRAQNKIHLHIWKGKNQTVLECNSGDNLMDVTNRIVNSDVNIYGLCDKQLACTTCAIDIESMHWQMLPLPSSEEIDVLVGLKQYKEGRTRMACQICIRQEMDGMVVRIHRQETI